MKLRVKRTGGVKQLKVERVTLVSLTNVENDLDRYQPGVDEKLLELVEATPPELQALRRARFHIERASTGKTAEQLEALRLRAKKARAVAKRRGTAIETTDLQRVA